MYQVQDIPVLTKAHCTVTRCPPGRIFIHISSYSVPEKEQFSTARKLFAGKFLHKTTMRYPDSSVPLCTLIDGNFSPMICSPVHLFKRGIRKSVILQGSKKVHRSKDHKFHFYRYINQKFGQICTQICSPEFFLPQFGKVHVPSKNQYFNARYDFFFQHSQTTGDSHSADITSHALKSPQVPTQPPMNKTMCCVSIFAQINVFFV